MGKILRTFGHHHVVTFCHMLGIVGSSLKMVKFVIQHLWVLRDVDRTCLARFVQECWAEVCALVRFSVAQHVATLHNRVEKDRHILRPSMLRYVALKCYDRLVGSLNWSVRNLSCSDVRRRVLSLDAKRIALFSPLYAFYGFQNNLLTADTTHFKSLPWCSLL